MLSGIDLGRVLGAQEMVAAIYREGWTGEQLEEFTNDLKKDGAPLLHRFAGDALRELEDTSLFPVMLELTAIRYVLEQSGAAKSKRHLQPVCEHGYVGGVNGCAKCKREAAR